MFNSLIESLKSFSFQSSVSGGVIGGGLFPTYNSGMSGSFGQPGLPGGDKSINSIDGNSKTLSAYYGKIGELTMYENNEITKSIISIYSDYLVGYFNTTDDLIAIEESVADRELLQTGVNEIFRYLDIISEVKANLSSIIYNGSYCIKIVRNESDGTFKKYDLENPNSVVTKFRGRDEESHIVIGTNGKPYVVNPDSIFRIGQADLPLIDDVSKKNDVIFGSDKDYSLVKTSSLYAGTPLYYNIMAKIKEYLLKEQLISLISIKDLIQPYIMSISLDNNTPKDEGIKFAINVENMINKSTDLSMVLGANFDINSIMNSISNNIKVIPDYHGGVGNMSDIDLSRISQKIIEAENMQDLKRENIFTYNGIPRALYNGDTTKWEAIKSSQRLNSKIHSIKMNITESLKYEAKKIIRQTYNRDIDLDEIKVNLFTKTDIDYNVSLVNLDILTQLMNGIQQALMIAQQSASEVRYIDSKKLLEYTRDQIKTIDPDLRDLITDETINSFLSGQGSGESEGYNGG